MQKQNLSTSAPLNSIAFQPRISLFARIVRQSLALTMISILIVGGACFFLAYTFLSGRVLRQVDGMATVREDTLEELVRSQRERVSLIAVQSTLDESAAQALLQKTWDTLQEQHVAVLGMAILSANRHAIASKGEVVSPLLYAVTSTTLVPVVDTKQGWSANDVYAPLRSIAGDADGYLAIRFGVKEILSPLFSIATLGSNGRMTLAFEQGGEIFVVDHSSSDEKLRSYRLGTVEDPHLQSLPLTLAVQGKEGVERAQNERGASAFAAYRFLPSLGWGMSVDVGASEALQDTAVLGIAIAVIGGLLLALSFLLSVIFARSLTAPLQRLATSMRQLNPGNWQFSRTVTTGDEVEVLDSVVSDLTGRLRESYAHLEDKVIERTQELRKQSALDRAILQTIEYGVVVTDERGLITAVNPAASMLLQKPQQEMIGKKAADVLVYTERKKVSTSETHPLTRVLHSRISYHSRPTLHPGLQRGNQTILPVSMVVTPLMQEHSLLGAVIVFQDMTEERQIDYMKSEFISLASHQLRTPLSSIRWYVEILSEESKTMTTDQQSYFIEIEKASRRMAHLLEALLHVARIDGGGLVPDCKEIDVVDILKQMVDEWKELSQEKGIVFSVAFPATALPVRTDPVLFQVIVQNFLSNSLKYSQGGQSILLRVQSDGKHAQVSVIDSGVGIPEDEKKRVFEKFFRAHNVRQLDTDGTGLGLYMSRAIAEKLGGTIAFESIEGKGTTFTFSFPIDPGTKC